MHGVESPATVGRCRVAGIAGAAILGATDPVTAKDRAVRRTWVTRLASGVQSRWRHERAGEIHEDDSGEAPRLLRRVCSRA
jgi:hypothetical protein